MQIVHRLPLVAASAEEFFHRSGHSFVHEDDGHFARELVSFLLDGLQQWPTHLRIVAHRVHVEVLDAGDQVLRLPASNSAGLAGDGYPIPFLKQPGLHFLGGDTRTAGFHPLDDGRDGRDVLALGPPHVHFQNFFSGRYLLCHGFFYNFHRLLSSDFWFLYHALRHGCQEQFHEYLVVILVLYFHLAGEGAARLESQAAVEIPGSGVPTADVDNHFFVALLAGESQAGLG